MHERGMESSGWSKIYIYSYVATTYVHIEVLHSYNAWQLHTIQGHATCESVQLLIKLETPPPYRLAVFQIQYCIQDLFEA